jgi:PST family polysaccharide transporter
VLGAGNQRIVDLVVGYFLGPALLGYLRVAWRMLDLLFEVVVRPIGNVSLTSLPRAQHAGRSLAAEYLPLIRYGAVIIVPMFLGFAVVAPDVVPLIFGAAWQTSAQLLSMLCFIGLFTPLTYFRSSVLIARGAYRHVFLVNLGEFVLSLLCALAFTPFGLISATIGYFVRAAVAAPLTMLYLERVAGISAWRSVRAGLPAAFAACCMLAVTHGVRLTLPADMLPAWRVAALICTGVLAYAAAILLTDRKLLTDAASLRAQA